MIRETSREAYRQIKNEGLLSRVKFEVYKVVCKFGPLTAAEVHKILSRGVSDSGGTYTSRLSELRDIGVIRELPKVPCPLTGRMAYQWEDTGKLPVKWEKPKTEKCKTCKGTGRVTTQQARLF